MRTPVLTAVIIAIFGGAATSYAQKAEPCRYFTFYLTINVSLTETNNGYSAESAVTCYDEYTNPYAGAFTAEAHVTDDSSGGTVDSREWDSTNCYTCAVDTWYAYMSGVATANHCWADSNPCRRPASYFVHRLPICGSAAAKHPENFGGRSLCCRRCAFSKRAVDGAAAAATEGSPTVKLARGAHGGVPC